MSIMSDLTAEPGAGLGAEPDTELGGVESSRDIGKFTLVGGKASNKAAASDLERYG